MRKLKEKEGLKFSTKGQWETFGKIRTMICGLQMIPQSAESISAGTQILPLVENEKRERRVLVLIINGLDQIITNYNFGCEL